MKALATILLLGACLSQTAAQVTKAWDKHFDRGLLLVDYAREIGTDAAGNVYIGGHSLIDIQQNGVTTVVKYDSSGNFKWLYTSAQDDLMEDMVVAPSGNVYFTGAAGASPAANDFVTVKLDPAGNVTWRRLFDGPGQYSDYATAIAIDSAENVYVTGNASTVVNGWEFTAVKYSSAGAQLWTASLPSLEPSYQNHAFDIAADRAGAAFVSGYQRLAGVDYLTMVKFSAAGAMQWWDTTSTHHNWDGVSHTYSKVDKAGNAYLLGNTVQPGSGCDLLLVKYGPGGKAWTRTWNSPGNDSDAVNNDPFEYYNDEALVLDDSGNVFISGTRSRIGTPHRDDIITAKYSPSGILKWSHLYNGAGDDDDRPYGLAIDKTGNPYICGATNYASGLGTVDFLTYKLNGRTGALAWEQTYDYGNFIDQAHAICVDARNNVYVTGTGAATTSILDPETHMVTLRYRQPAGSGIAGSSPLQALAVYPNPAGSTASLLVRADRAGNASWTLTDALGQVVASAAGLRLGSGRQTVTLPVASLPAGIYTLSFSLDGFAETRLLTILH